MPITLHGPRILYRSYSPNKTGAVSDVQTWHYGIRLLPADILAMFTIPIRIVPPAMPSLGTAFKKPFIKFVTAEYVFRGTPYTLQAPADSEALVIGPYSTQAGLGNNNMGTWITPAAGLIDQAADATAQVWSTAGGFYGAGPHAPEEDGVWISTLIGNPTLGNGIIDLHMDFRSID